MKRSHQKKKPRAKPKQVNAAVSAALAHHRAGRLSQAQTAYEKVLKADPTCVEALYLLGRLQHQTGNLNKAIDLLRQALAGRPTFLEAQNDLGNMLKDAGQLEDAAQVLVDLIKANPQHADAHNNLGVVLKRQGELDAAVRAFERAIQLDPQCAGQHFNLGNTLKQLSRFQEAARAYRRAIDLNPEHADAHRQLIAVLRRIDKWEESKHVLTQWVALSPNDPVPLHMLAACSDADPPPRASDAYVKKVFDEFADAFDDTLNALDYQGPKLLAEALGARLQPADGRLDVLDVGCGTGLCGRVLQPYSRRLVGVDLSSSMLDKARRLDVYDELIAVDIAAFLAGSVDRFDLIACIDTLIYFGDLSAVLAGMATVLRDGGCLIFTCEEHSGERSPNGYHLAAHGRYGHTIDYIHDCLTGAGLSDIVMTPAVLRTEAGESANCNVVVASKTALHEPG